MKQLLLRTCTLAFSFLVLLVSISNAQVQTARYISTGANSKAFYEYLPQGYATGSETYPLIVFMHGLGELGAGTSASLPTILRNGVPRVINDGRFPVSFTVNGETHKFIVISPQFVAWPAAVDVQNVINYAVSHYRVNTARIYLTGLSMGGGATWDYAGNSSANANLLAAIVPVCGANWPDMTRSKNIGNANLPVWATHNIGDPTVPVVYTNDYVKNINSVFPTPLARKTIFNFNTHDAWTRSYDPAYRENSMNVYEWMLQYQRGSAPINIAPTANAGADKINVLPTNSVTLAGSGADVDGTVTKYSWTKLAGPTQFSISNAAITNPVISNLTPGTYAFRLTVTDNDNATAFNDMSISVASLPGSLFPGKIQAESFASMSGVQIAGTTDAGGGYCVGYIAKGDWFEYNATVPVSGTYTASFRVSSTNTGGQFSILRADGTVLTTVNVPNTGANQSWSTVTVSVNLTAGNQTFKLVSNTNGLNQSSAWNINWVEFTAVSVTLPNASLSGTTTGTNQAGTEMAEKGLVNKSALRMYPNPVVSNFSLELNNLEAGQVKVQLIDMMGRIREEQNFTKKQQLTHLSVSSAQLPAGTYFVRVQIGKWTDSQKFIKL